MEINLEKPPLIFVVDDDEDDLFFIKSAIINNLPNSIVKCYRNGKQLMEGLNKTNCKLPCFILMDLNMPVLSGKEALKLIRQNKLMNNMPVIILSTGNNPSEISLLYKIGANNYFCKPAHIGLYDEIICCLKREYIDKVAVS